MGAKVTKTIMLCKRTHNLTLLYWGFMFYFIHRKEVCMWKIQGYGQVPIPR